MRLAGALCALLLPAALIADQSIADKYPESVLYDRPREVVPGVWSAIGATAPPTYENAGHNNNLSFVITGDGVLVVNGGACYQLARALHEEIGRITEQPVRLVVNENGQGHAMLGNTYWREQGVPIIAHVDAAAEFAAHGHDILARMREYNREQADGTEVTLPDRTFESSEVIELGGMRFELLSFGPAHSPGDISVWLPELKLVIAGDMAFHERLLPIFEDTYTADWLESWQAFAALGAEVVIPGHGAPTDMAEVTRYTHDYLVHLRAKVRELLDAGGSLAESYDLDQSPYAHLDTFEELSARNAERVYREMEFE